MQDTPMRPPPAPSPVSFIEALGVWAKIGVLSFGGPAGQIALMHRILVEERQWIDDRRFLPALNFCMLLPGPEATQLATYVGWRMHGIKGGLVAGLLFVLPGAAVILALAMLYALFGRMPMVEAAFVGIKAAVLAIVIEALLRVSKRALQGAVDIAIAAGAFIGIFLLAIPFPIIIAAAALIGFVRGIGQTAMPIAAEPVSVSAATTLRTIVVWLGIWLAPVLAIAIAFGSDHVLAQIAWFFSKLAVVTFGGAYAVLAYMAQAAVEGYGWLDASEMLDGLGLAETTPGPLILVTEFVGYIAAHHSGSGFNPILFGIFGALVALWATFAPCFLWIFAFAPYVERLNLEPRLSSALRAVTAAVVGVIFNLSVWFGLHVIFAKISERDIGPMRLLVPDVSSISGTALMLSLVAMALLFVWHRGIFTTLAVCGALALAWNVAATAL